MKIGFVSLPLSGHVLPISSLMRKLRSRGHEVVYLGVPDMKPLLVEADLPFLPCCAESFPPGSIAGLWEPITKMHGLEVVEDFGKNICPRLLQPALKELPHLILEHGVDALVVDAAFYYVQLAAMSVPVPFIQVSLALHADPTGATPPLVFSWPYETTPEALARNKRGLEQLGKVHASCKAIGHAFAERVQLALSWDDPTATVSKLALITQTPKEFDYPVAGLPPQFHYTGPFQDPQGRRAIPFSWQDLDGRPLVYVSLGTLLNGLDRLYKTILEAVAGMPDLQVVLSTGSNIAAKDLGELPQNTIVVEQAPQLELLKRAALCITHAGLNTALEALGEGVPMVAIPIGLDQPGVAARIAYHHVGEFLEVEDLTVANLSGLIRKVNAQPEYRENARRFQQILAGKRGLDIAAEAVETAFAKVAGQSEAPGATQAS